MSFIVFVEDSRVEYGEVERETETRAIRARADGGHGNVGCGACTCVHVRARSERRAGLRSLRFSSEPGERALTVFFNVSPSHILRAL